MSTASGLFTLLLLFTQTIDAKPAMCCESKTVGDYAYSLVDAGAAVPSECPKSCVYSRNDKPGSLYCFAPGELVVECEGEMDVSIGYSFPEYNCTPVANTEIWRYMGHPAEPSHVTQTDDFEGCNNYCISLCWHWPWCECQAWTWNPNGTCYLYPYTGYETRFAPGFWSGGICYGTDDNGVTELSEEDAKLTRMYKYFPPQGAVNSRPQRYFSDYKISLTGKITKIDVYFSKVKTIKAITGIQVFYGEGSTNGLHGIKGVGSETKTFEFEPQTLNPCTGVYGRSVNTPTPSSFVGQLGFYKGGIKESALPPTSNFGNTFDSGSSQDYVVSYISGYTIGSDGVIGQLKFHFKSN